MFPTNWLLAHFTTLLYFVSIGLLLRHFVGLALPGPRMYAESYWDITLSSDIIHVAAVN